MEAGAKGHPGQGLATAGDPRTPALSSSVLWKPQHPFPHCEARLASVKYREQLINLGTPHMPGQILSYKALTIAGPILQKRKLRLSNVKQFVQGEKPDMDKAGLPTCVSVIQSLSSEPPCFLTN